MDEKTLKKIIENREKFIPLLFTAKQVSIIERYIKKEKLSNSDKKALYTSVNKKVRALECLYQEKETEFYIRGSQHIIQSRIKEAKSIINSFPGEKVFVAGSFLFSDRYNDIDIYIIRKKGYKEVYEEKKHIIYLSEKRLKQAIFQSAALISVSNFDNTLRYAYKAPFLHELMGVYHEAVIEFIQNDAKKEALRDLIFMHSILCKGELVDALELRSLVSNIAVEGIDSLFMQLCRHVFSKTYLYVEIHQYIKSLKNAIAQVKQNKHLTHYKTTYEDLIYGRKRSEAKAY